MPRLFTGVEIPPDVGQALSTLRGGLPGARWIDPENYHVTLRFIGDVDDAIAQEIAKFVGRSDITEEVVRFRGHLEHWRALSDSAEPCGRKLDFLLQEMNREVNTLGSKGNDALIAEVVIELKDEIEKLREQVANVE